jgi:hypothetical protein
VAIALRGLKPKLINYLRDQGYVCDAAGPGTAQIVMLRGCEIHGGRELRAGVDPLSYRDTYDDVIVVFGQKSGGQDYLAAYDASAKPGLAWIRHSSYAGSTRGCPTVQPGQYVYVRGDHRGHQAMRQAWQCPVCVIRDVDQDARLEYTSDLVDYPWDTGINIHAGGTSSRVGLNSSGCQIIRGGWGGASWRGFHRIIYTVAKGQKRFHYTVANYDDFAAWHDADQAERDARWNRLRFGSGGIRVRELQVALAKLGLFGMALVDGEWGRTTDRAVRRWQRDNGLAPDGCMTPEMLREVSR